METGAGHNVSMRNLGTAVQVDERRIHAHLDQVVRFPVEEMLNALLDAEADHWCGAGKYVRTDRGKDTRAGAMIVGCRPGPAKYRSRSRSCATSPSRPR